MPYRITGLDPEPFRRALGAPGTVRRVADERPGYPCRVSLDDAEVGEELILVSYEHQPAPTPYRASGPVYVRAGAARFDAVDQVPPALARRTLHAAAAGCFLARVDRVAG